MGKVNLFQIMFDKPTSVFSPGDQVTGKIMLDLNEAIKTREIRLKFHGEARVKWTEGSGDHRRTKRAKEEYFYHTLSLFNKEITGTSDDPTLPAGNQVFAFFYNLPFNIPTSYEGKYGSVRYYASCTIDLAWQFDEKCTEIFTIISPYDLNNQPQLAEGVYLEDEKTLCCCCCEEGPIRCRASVPKKGFVPGETMCIKIEVENKADSGITDVEAKLKEYTEFHTTSDLKCSNRTLAEISFGSCAPHESLTFQEPSMVVPPCVSTELPFCNIILVDYQLEITLNPAGLGLPLHVIIPIIIGTVPLWTSVGFSPPLAAPPTSGQDHELGFQLAPTAPPPPVSQDQAPDLPPPSYESCVFGSVSAKDDDDGDGDNATGNWTNYTPFYPVYHSLSPNPPPPPYPSGPSTAIK